MRSKDKSNSYQTLPTQVHTCVPFFNHIQSYEKKLHYLDTLFENSNSLLIILLENSKNTSQKESIAILSLMKSNSGVLALFSSLIQRRYDSFSTFTLSLFLSFIINFNPIASHLISLNA